MNLTFDPEGWEDYLDWRATHKERLRKLNGLIRKCLRHPYQKTGKLEPL